MDKKRKAFYEIEKAFEFYDVVSLLGIRKVGKTTILKQLAEVYNGTYIDYKFTKEISNIREDIINSKTEYIFLDEVTFIEDFDEQLQSINQLATEYDKKIVITGSAYPVIQQFTLETLGGSRAYIVHLHPMDFEEYLYFSGKISKYSEDYIATKKDVDNFYKLVDTPKDMKIIIDKDYLKTSIHEHNTSVENLYRVYRGSELSYDICVTVIDILAYTLNKRFKPKVFGKTNVGAMEFLDYKSLNLESTIIALANKEVFNYNIDDIIKAIGYMLETGMAYLDIVKGKNKEFDEMIILDNLLEIDSKTKLSQEFSYYGISVISPLIYTRLLLGLEFVANRGSDNNSLNGELYELAIKSESVYLQGFNLIHKSNKVKIFNMEVDLYVKYKDNILLLEATITDKNDKEHNLSRVYMDIYAIRVLTCSEDKEYEFNGIYHRIPYPQALLMLSNKTIFDLEPTKIEESNGLESFSR